MRQNACSSKSKVGTGSAVGFALNQRQDLKLTAFNAAKGKQLLIRVQGDTPLQIDEILVGKLSSASGAYGTKLTVEIPPTLQQPASGVIATLLDFKLAVKGGSSKTPFVGLRGCTSGGLKFKGVFTFTDGTSQTVTTKATCKK